MSRRPLFAMTSDWHLQRGAWKRANTPQGDSFFALQQLYRFCHENEVDLLGAGDLLDELQPDTVTLSKLFWFLDDMQRIGRQVVFTQGQHEKAEPPYLSLHPHPRRAHRKVVHLRGVSVYGMDHVPADQLEAEAARVPSGIDVLMCHQVWNDFMGLGYEGQLSVLSEAGGPGIVLTGDYHDHRVLEVDGLKVYSPGSTCLQEIGERRDKAFFVMYDDLSVESVPLLTRRVCDFLIQSEADLEHVLGMIDREVEPDPRLPEDMQKPVFYVQCGRVEQAFARIGRAVKGRAFVFWKSLVGDAGDTVYDEREADRVAPRGLEGCLPLVTQPGGPVYNSVLRLLRSTDEKAELAAMAAEFGR